jgi:hypothetical protein
MARLRRQWGVQFRHVLTDEWLAPMWMLTRADAEHSLEMTDGTGSSARLVTQVASDVEVVPRGQA